MTIQHSFSYASALAESQKVNWRVEDLIGGPHKLDFTRPFLPDSLVRVHELSFLSPSEKLTLNHIRGATYLHLFGVVEEFILPFAIARAEEQLATDKVRTRALLTFAEEEAKHQQLFARFAEEFARNFHTKLDFIGPATEIAAGVLANSPLAVGILTLHLEWLTQAHFLEGVKTDEQLDPLFVSLLKHHWQEEATHAKLDTLVVDELASRSSPAEIEKAVDEFLAIGGVLDGGFQAQVKLDLEGLERAAGRRFSASERQRIEEVQLASYRWTFLVSGLLQKNFSDAIRDLGGSAASKVQAVAQALRG